MKARATLAIQGDRYEPEGSVDIEIQRQKDAFAFSWKAVDSAGTEIAADAKSLALVSMDNPQKPHAFLEQYIRTHIQKTQLKRKNKLKVTEWTWLER